MLFIITKGSALILTLFFHSVVCANGHIVEGLTGKYLFCVNKKSFYLQQSHIIMKMEDSLII